MLRLGAMQQLQEISAQSENNKIYGVQLKQILTLSAVIYNFFVSESYLKGLIKMQPHSVSRHLSPSQS